MKKSIKFKPVAYDEKKTQFVEICVSNDCAIAIDQNGKLWGWGTNTSNKMGITAIEEGGISKPFALYQINDKEMKALKISVGDNHSLVLFENKDGVK
jgi:alpha-tubulin suppressor-like RCC1 family protein